MTESPSRTALAVARRPFDSRDAAFERQLFAESRDDLLLLVPGDTRDVIVDMQFRAQRREWRRDFPSVRHEVLLVRDVRAGHVLVAEDAATLTIVDLIIRTGLRGLGLGSLLVGELVDEADATDRTVRTRVWAANGGARRFFAGNGFRSGGLAAGWHELYRPPSSRAA